MRPVDYTLISGPFVPVLRGTLRGQSGPVQHCEEDRGGTGSGSCSSKVCLGFKLPKGGFCVGRGDVPGGTGFLGESFALTVVSALIQAPGTCAR